MKYTLISLLISVPQYKNLRFIIIECRAHVYKLNAIIIFD